jgi:hypothetical protein
VAAAWAGVGAEKTNAAKTAAAASMDFRWKNERWIICASL